MKRANSSQFDLNERYFFELYLSESPDELKSFHQQILQMIHNHSEPYEDYLTNAHYRSWVGLSYPKFGLLNQYVAESHSLNPEYRLHFAISHPALFIGDTVHFISVSPTSLKTVYASREVQALCRDGCEKSDIYPAPLNCAERIFKRDRRPERRSEKKNLKRTRLFNISATEKTFEPEAITEPLPRIRSVSSKNKSKPIHIRQMDANSPVEGWFSIYGLSTHGTTVPLIPTENTKIIPIQEE